MCVNNSWLENVCKRECFFLFLLILLYDDFLLKCNYLLDMDQIQKWRYNVIFEQKHIENESSLWFYSKVTVSSCAIALYIDTKYII